MSFYRHLHREEPRPAPLHFEHGAHEHRGREGALLVQMNCNWRAHKAGKSIIHLLADGVNAFGCISQQTLDNNNSTSYLNPMFAELLVCRHREMVIEVKAWDGTCHLMPGQGGLMGNETAPKDFCMDFSMHVLAWDLQLRDYDKERFQWFRCHDPVSGKLTDLSIALFVDDVTKAFIVKGFVDSITTLKVVNDKLDEALDRGDYAQNITKQVIVPRFTGEGAIEATRALCRHAAGQVFADARLLGERLHSSLSNVTQKQLKLQNLSVSWYLLGDNWFKRLSRGMCRTTYLCFLMNTALSGMVCFIWGLGDCKEIDKKLNRYLRAMTKGASAGFDVAAGCYHAWSDFELHHYWRVVPMSIEIVVRRLKYYARVARFT